MEHAFANPDFLWSSPEPRAAYDVVIVGGGLHGLSTAYHLARYQGVRRIAVLERGWLGGGNAVRNTAIIRSNYLRSESMPLYDFCLTRWEAWADEIGEDIAFSQRGLLNVAHSRAEANAAKRVMYANRLYGIDAEWLEPDDIRRFCPILNLSSGIRYPVVGATLQARVVHGSATVGRERDPLAPNP